jgi:non-canonical poly(A) RNA polymerase PAPD5/7
MIQRCLREVGEDVSLVRASRPSDSCPWCNGFEYRSESTSLALHREIVDFVAWIGPTREEKYLRCLVITRFRNCVKTLWPSARTICHGSSAVDCYLPSGDIDFVVYDPPGDGSPLELLLQLHRHLQELQVFVHSEVIRSARVPIIEGIEKPFGYRIDIALAIGSVNGILNIERNRNLFQAYPALYPLLMFVKFFVFQARLDEPYHGGIGSNTLQNMSLFVIQAAAEGRKLNLGHLLVNFFKLFGRDFNYVRAGIATRNGGRLFSKADIGRVKREAPVRLCIEDPQIPGKYLGENSSKCPEFKAKCRVAYENLMSEGRPNEQSMLLRIITRPDVLIRRKDELARHYATLAGKAIESFSLEDDERARRRGSFVNDRRRKEKRPFVR